MAVSVLECLVGWLFVGCVIVLLVHVVVFVVSMHAFMHECICMVVFVCVCVYVGKYACMSACMYVVVYVRACLYVCMHV